MTRSKEDIERDRVFFERFGFEVVSLPLIRTEPLPFEVPIQKPKYIVFQSPKAIAYFLNSYRVPSGVRLVAVGIKTARRLEEFGLKANVVPKDNSAKGIVEALPVGKGEVVYIPRSAQGRVEALQGLREKGYKVFPIDVYKTEELSYEPGQFISMLGEGGFIVFASPSAVRAFFANLQNTGQKDINESFVITAIGKTTKEELEKFGIEPSIIPVKPLMEEVAGKIHLFWQENCID